MKMTNRRNLLRLKVPCLEALELQRNNSLFLWFSFLWTLIISDTTLSESGLFLVLPLVTHQCFNERGKKAEMRLNPLVTLQVSQHDSVSFCTVSAEQKNFDEESIASLSTSVRDETRDGFCPDDLTETSALQALQERTYGFSFWPKVSPNQPTATQLAALFCF